ncbi:MAG: hypothetical protein NT123_05635 [Proteobacteria bacterium]|nr:hypothetical protein [Pseudomonadota bacterium]
MAILKHLLKEMLGEKVLGGLEYLRFRETRKSWGGPLNGQERRQEMVASLISKLRFNAVVETGTYRATSTEYFADLCTGHVFTIEISKRYYGYSTMRLLLRRNVTILHGDSRSALRSLTKEPRLSGCRVFFYLDSHWDTDLPLAEELQLVFTYWPHAVVLIDDFQVPDDPGYGFDCYGAGNALTLGYARVAIEQFGLEVFFPAAHSSEETGAKRGCVLFVGDSVLTNELGSLSDLRHYDPAAFATSQ